MRYARLPSVLFLFCGWFAAGCVDDQLGLQIVHFVKLDPMTNMCVADPASAVTLSRGFLDTGIAAAGTRQGEVLAPIIVNLLQPAPTGTPPTNDIFVTGFDVEVKIDPADTVLNGVIPPEQLKFHLAAAGGVVSPSGGMATASMGLGLQVEVINTDVAKLMNAALPDGEHFPPLTIHMRPTGDKAGLKTNGGYVDFPVYVCKFCLDPPPAACPQGGFPMGTKIVDGCHAAQDPETCCINPTTGRLDCGSGVLVKTM